MLPDTRQAETLLAIIDTGSLEQAAALLHISPSAVSQRLSAMESALGTPLILRGRPCQPTAAGQRLLQYLRRSQLLEAEFLADQEHDQRHPLSVAIGVNNDSLSTWLLPQLTPFLVREQILLDIILDDQDHTYALLEGGLALAAVSSEPQAMRGCSVEALGVMRYHLLASADFAARHFPTGLNRESARTAPMMVFDRKDMLQAHFMLREFGLPVGSYPCHYVPASNPFVHAVRLGLGYGMVAEQQYGDMLTSGELIDLAPGNFTDVALYWHAWRVQSPKLERLSAATVAAARQVLLPMP